MTAPVFAEPTGTPIIGAVGYPVADVVVPEATGTPTPTYAAVGTLPAGVAFDATTRTISFTAASIEVGSGTLTVRATNTDGMADWTVAYEFVTIGMSVSVSASETHIEVGDSVTLTGEAYGDLVSISQGGADAEGLWALTQVNGTWRIIQIGTIADANLRNPRGLTTRGGNLYAIDWWGEDIWRITGLDTSTATEIGAETSGSLGSPEGAAFLGDVFWAIDDVDNALWSWADVDNSPNDGQQRGILSLSGDPRGMTVRNNLLAVVYLDGTSWVFAQIDNPATGTISEIATVTRPADITGDPRALQEWRGGLWIFTDDQELVELTGIGDTPALIERADFDEAGMGSHGPGGMTQFPMPVTYAWSSDSGGTFTNAATETATWDSTGVATGTAATLTMRVIDGAGNSFDRSVIVQVGGSAPSFADDTGDQINAHVGDTIPDVVVPEALGSPAPTYAVVGTLPAGVTFTPATRTLSFDGDAITPGTGTITIRATNPAGSDDWTVVYLFTAAQVAPSFADNTGDPISAMLGDTIADVTVPAAAGNPAPTYAVVGTLPAGVTFSGRVLSFDGSAIQVGTGTIRVRATNSAGSADWTVAYTFTPQAFSGDAEAANWEFDVPDATAQHTAPGNDGIAVAVNWSFDVPQATGATVPPAFDGDAEAASFAFEVPTATGSTPMVGTDGDASPANWAFNVPDATGATVAPGNAGDAEAVNFLFNVPDATGSTVTPMAAGDALPASWSFHVPAASAGTPRAAFTNPVGRAITGTVGGAAISVTVPAADGTPAPTYAVVGTLPPGLMFDPTTRILSGTPTATGSGTIRIRATNALGTDDWLAPYSFTDPATVPAGHVIPTFVADEAVALVKAAAEEIGPTAADMGARAATLVHDGNALGAALEAAIVAVTDIALLENLAFNGLATYPPVIGTTVNRRAQRRNQAIFTDLLRSIATERFAEAVGVESYRDRTEAVRQRNLAGDALDDRAADADTATFTALRSLRAAVVEHVDAEINRLPPVIVATPATVRPSLVLSYEFYGDVDRADEIVGRVDTPRPGFIPASPIVLPGE